MFDLKALPRKPEDALSELLIAMLEVVPHTNEKIRELNYKQTSEIRLLARAAAIVIQRIDDEDLQEIAKGNLEFEDQQSANEYREDIERVQESLYLSGFEKHFLDQDCISSFDQAKLSDSEKGKIRDLLSKARILTDEADFLSQDHKRRINHRISDVENELYKEISGFKAFLAAAADVSGLVKKFGEDAQPIAEAIETARTVTERKVDGYKKIAEQEKPKSLPKPDSKPLQ
ncbi:DNA topoisomerase IV subunit B [Roseobacter sp. SK209-2-6]|uniref:hypothetical protein n=1 Tax=Roseobacter sp. SK209-2-6 TaxID=388739 RepID=UPI0000F3F448|nr:hypothetical protein [Roseobacter sp. SK209-2-6]EBA16498.1 DNA topoisomerase IV subunit B [Roseobacter sp. SK209-2-6]